MANKKRSKNQNLLIALGIALLLVAILGLGTIVKILLVVLGIYFLYKGLKK